MMITEAGAGFHPIWLAQGKLISTYGYMCLDDWWARIIIQCYTYMSRVNLQGHMQENKQRSRHFDTTSSSCRSYVSSTIEVSVEYSLLLPSTRIRCLCCNGLCAVSVCANFVQCCSRCIITNGVLAFATSKSSRLRRPVAISVI